MSKVSTLVPMRSTAVKFSHGMIVNETDLTAAMNYPVQLMQAVNRANYGCGVICGFMFEPDPDLCGAKKPCENCDTTGRSGMAYPGFRLKITRGTAIDCHGMPLELCEPAYVDIEPKQCGCSDTNAVICIAARRVSGGEAPRGDCCDDTGGQSDCTRLRDHLELKAFPSEKLPEHICMRELPMKSGSGDGCGNDAADSTDARRPDSTDSTTDDCREAICRCLIECEACECCGDGWVLLGCVTVCEAGIRVENFPEIDANGNETERPIEPYIRRKWVKSIECICADVHQSKTSTIEADTVQIQEALAERMRELRLTKDQVSATMTMASVSVPEKLLEQFNEDPVVVAKMLGLKQNSKHLERVVNLIAGVDIEDSSEG